MKKNSRAVGEAPASPGTCAEPFGLGGHSPPSSCSPGHQCVYTVAPEWRASTSSIASRVPFNDPGRGRSRQQRRLPDLHRGGADRVLLPPLGLTYESPHPRPLRDRLPLAAARGRGDRDRRALHPARPFQLRPRIRVARERPAGRRGEERPGLLRLRTERPRSDPRTSGEKGWRHELSSSATTLDNGLRVLTRRCHRRSRCRASSCSPPARATRRPSRRDRPLRRAHVLQGHGAAADGARDLAGEIDGIGGEFNAFTGKEFNGYYVKCAAGTRDVALDVLVDMIRNSRFDAEEIDREKGVIVEEMNMYFDTPRDFIGGVYDDAALRRPPARPRRHRHEGDGRARDPRDLHVVHRPLVSAGAHGRRGRRPDRRRPAPRGSRSCSARSSRARPGMPEPVAPPPNGAACRCSRSSPTRRTSCSARAATRWGIPTATRCSCSRPCSAAACRRGSSPRCASAAASPTTSSARTRATSTPARSTRRRASTSSGSTTRSRRSPRELRRIADETVPADELEKARAFAKGRFVLAIESPHGTTMFGLRREVLLGAAEEPEEVLAGLDAVTAEDIQRVAQDVVADGAEARGDRPVRRRQALREAALACSDRAASRRGRDAPASCGRAERQRTRQPRSTESRAADWRTSSLHASTFQVADLQRRRAPAVWRAQPSAGVWVGPAPCAGRCSSPATGAGRRPARRSRRRMPLRTALAGSRSSSPSLSSPGR